MAEAVAKLPSLDAHAAQPQRATATCSATSGENHFAVGFAKNGAQGDISPHCDALSGSRAESVENAGIAQENPPFLGDYETGPGRI
jgi:hypothetical protein